MPQTSAQPIDMPPLPDGCYDYNKVLAALAKGKDAGEAIAAGDITPDRDAAESAAPNITTPVPAPAPSSDSE